MFTSEVPLVLVLKKMLFRIEGKMESDIQHVLNKIAISVLILRYSMICNFHATILNQWDASEMCFIGF